MKKLVLLFTGMLLSITTVTATEVNTSKKGKGLDITKRYRYAQPVVFTERGVEFLIFPDGSFDFNTNNERSHYNNNMYYKSKSKRRSVNTTYGAPGRRVKYSGSKYGGVSISHDRNGKVRRIGNVYLNYDRYGKIKRAGSVYMNYSRRQGRLKQVGGLHVNYNHWGEIVNTRGQVNRFNDNCNFCGTDSCSMDHSDHNRNRHNDNDWFDNDDIYNNDDDSHYYYKQNGKVKKQKRKRRK